jgi:hypothetical protein
MNCIIIDDDKLSRTLLEKFVERTEYIDQYYSFPGAIEAIISSKRMNTKLI